ncbi:hypothetical protein ZWY2020_057781 [Hordeum vulgare]|nr:hypothetical protein ZWY2020_057781 [Hordeum vulgare]
MKALRVVDKSILYEDADVAQEIDISWTVLSSDDILGIMCKLPNLLNLILWRKSYTNDLLVASTKYQFRVLKQLVVTSDLEEHKIVIFEQGSMEMLEKLEVRFGQWEKSITGIEHLPSLKEVVLIGKRSNDSLNQAVVQLKSQSKGRLEPNQFKVGARYE